MKEVSKNYINQYKLLFYLSWIVLYFIFPAWRFPQIYISFTNQLIEVPYWWERILGFLTYFFIAAYLLNYYFNNLFIDRPLIIHSNDWFKHVKNNLWLVTICCIAVVLHIFNFSLGIGASYYSLWAYNLINSYWHKFFDIPIQYPIWAFIFFMFLILRNRKCVNTLSNYINSGYSAYKSNYLVKLISIVSLIGFFIIYAKSIPYYTWSDHLFITGYPPLGTVLSLTVYSLLGTGNVFLTPIIVQSTFYVLGGVFLFRTINLFYEKEAALLGASIYLFSPLIFSYATVGDLGCGTVFFIIAVSYFFLKFIRDEGDHDLVLTAFFLSIGMLYKRDILLLFLICSAYLIVRKIKQNNLLLRRDLSILSLAPISFLPWFFIGSRGADKTVWSHLTSPDTLFSALLMVLSQLSWPVFLLFMLSIIFALYKRDNLSAFFGIVFIVYYVIFTTLEQQTVHRYSMAFYPTISVFLSMFIYNITKKVRWEHTFKAASMVLIIYLAVLCIVPRSSTTLITFKYTDFENQQFPVEKAMEWVLNETGDDERVLIFGFGQQHLHYARQKGIDPEKIILVTQRYTGNLSLSDAYEAFSQNLKQQCEKHKISYIMFNAYDEKISHPFYQDMFSETHFIKKTIIRRKLEERKMMKFLKENKYNDYEKFNLDGNSIYIYKLSNDSVVKQL